MPQPLGSKDSSLFRQLVRHYENKQYKKGTSCSASWLLFAELANDSLPQNHQV